jgi:hypothetical protein
MGSKKKGASAPRPRSGFVTEEQRGTVRLNLRLPKLVADLLEDASQNLDANKNALVALALLKTFGNRFLSAPAAAETLEDEINHGKHRRRE